jgi:hypothetical protein
MAQTVILQHDVAHPHAAAATRQKIRNLKFEVLPHLPYSPILTSCDFHACGPIKEALRGGRFGCDEVQEAVPAWIWEQPKTCLSDVIRKLVDRYKKCLNCRETILKNSRDVVYISLSLSLLKLYFLYFFI